MRAMFRRPIERFRAMQPSARGRFLDAAARVLGLAIGIGLGVLAMLAAAG